MEVTFYGLGTIGSNLMIALLKQSPDWHYIGVDFDKVEDRNIRIQAYFKEQISIPKPTAIWALASRYVNKVNYTPQIKRVSEKIIPCISKEQLYLDCFDNTLSRKFLNIKNGANILHLGFSPLYAAECIWDEKYDVPNDIPSNLPDICQMHDAIGFIHYFLGAVVMVINEWANTGQKRSFILTNKFDLRWI